MPLLDAIVAQADALRAIRRDIHAHPELAFEETRTADLVAERLEAWGIPIHRGLAKTGVVGIIRGERPDNGRTVGLRADMDALPMQEANTFEHASRHPGKMHACGHDGHTTMLLGAAQYLAAHRDFAGTVYLIFQPAEEQAGGAREMVKEGLFEQFPMDAVFGMHNMPGIPSGTFALSPGPVLASNSEFTVTVRGKGGHAAMPHLGVDPLPIAAQILGAFQNIVSRNKKPLDVAVISVTMIHGGEAVNVIPDTCEMRGTVRAYTTETLDLIERRMREIAELTCSANEAQCDFDFQRKYPATFNHEAETEFARGVIAEIVDEGQLITQTPIMAAEDFAFMLEVKPGCYAFIGNGDGDHREEGHGHGPCLVHNTSYDFNDEVLPLGATYLSRLALSWLDR
ncbi:M20 family metallopeptidase [Pusillimonas sp. MFBS29]|uniref:M20 aminoacylase family protein n=1 Tax=Pusillimonas sp. MFBS29 TaxID=2886690 RepID=UPI001D11D458|nr:M20 aminoacylase family protein [Pusillimonas sp. MFBS29]MCC2595727.1 M20 family metallopeptidase [Pusillimonas sp. MFBS29]